MSEWMAATGGCQCGAVRYRLEVAPLRAGLCHCRMCQKASGGPFMAFAAVPADKIVFTSGAVSTFASSDSAERGFCANCGTPLTFHRNGTDTLSVTLCSLDEPNAIEPNFQIGAESRVRWLMEGLALPDTQTEEWLARRRVARFESNQHPDHDR